MFFAQHSIMVRRPIRARITSVIPVRYDDAFYAITSGIALTVYVLFQPVGPPLFVLDGAGRAIVNAIALPAVAGFAWGAAAPHSFDPFGLGPIKAHLRGTAADRFRAKPFVVRGPYAFGRHSLYSFMIVLLWASPTMSPSRLTVAVLWTA